MDARLLLLCLIVCSSSALPTVLNSKHQLQWQEWKETHGKSYLHEREEVERSLVWMDNKKFIDSHNAQGRNTYTLSLNQFADMTEEEWRDSYLGHIPGNDTIKSKLPVFKVLSTDYPSHLDWRTNNIIPPVKDQHRCNSSYAFSAIGALEGVSALVTGSKPPFSEQNILDCSVPYGNHGCNGGSVYNTYQYILSEGGIDYAINYPYQAMQQQCRFDEKAVGAEISGMVRIESGNEADLLAAVATVGPISVAVDASSKSFMFYSGGVFNSIHCSRTSLNHAMVVIGYGIDDGKRYWTVKNSWGKSWGEGGYIRMMKDSYNQCGIATDALYPTL